MNSFLTEQVHNEISIRQTKPKKKNMPICINSNPNPGKFLFSNKISKVATAYKKNGEQIQNLEKNKQLHKNGKTQVNTMVNNFLSINSKLSQFSNGSILSKNSTKIISSRGNPAKNLSTSIFSKGKSGSKLLLTNKSSLQETITNRLGRDGNNSKKKYNTTTYSNNFVKSNMARQKSIELISTKNAVLCKKNSNNYINTHSKNYNSNIINPPQSLKVSSSHYQEIQNVNSLIHQRKNTESNQNNINMKKKRVTTSKYPDKENIKKYFKKPKATISTNLFNEIPASYNYNTSGNNRNNILTTLSSFTNTLGNNVNTINNISHSNHGQNHQFNYLKHNKRGFSYENITLPKRMLSKNSINTDSNKLGYHPKRNHSININRFALNNFIISNNNEKKIKKEIAPVNPGIKINLNSILQNIKIADKKETDSRNNQRIEEQKHQRSLSKNISQGKNSIKLEEVDIESDRLLSENNAFPVPNLNIYKNLFEDEEFIFDDGPYVEDKFDDLNSIVKRINFNLNFANSNNIFRVELNHNYITFKNKFDNDFEKKVFNKKKNINFNSTSKKNNTISKAGISKSSERKNMNNISLSTQENSYKKYLASPFH